MRYTTKCKNCTEFFKGHGKYCSMSCSIKGNKTIIPKKYTMREIKDCLENNIGICINLNKISEYSREILKLI